MHKEILASLLFYVKFIGVANTMVAVKSNNIFHSRTYFAYGV